MGDDDLPLGDPLGWTMPEVPTTGTGIGPEGSPGTEPDPASSTVPDPIPGPDDGPFATTPDLQATDPPLWPAAGLPRQVPEAPSIPVAEEPLWPAAAHPPQVPPSASLAGPTGTAPGGAVAVEGWVAAPPAKGIGRRIPRIVVIGLAVVIGVVVAAGVIGGDSRTVNVGDLRAGDCFDDPTADGGDVVDVQHRACSEPHQFEVFASFQFPADGSVSFPGDSGFDSFEGKQCDPAFTSFVGIPEADSSLTWAAYQPVEAGWDTGDREITCFLQDRHEARLTGSVKGTHR